MNLKRIIANCLIVCMFIHLTGCYTTKTLNTTKTLTSDNLEFKKTDVVVSIYYLDGREVPIEPSQVRKTYVSNDTLIIDLMVGNYPDKSELKYKIPISEIKSVEVREIDVEKTIKTGIHIVGAVAIVAGALVGMTVGMIFAAFSSL